MAANFFCGTPTVAFEVAADRRSAQNRATAAATARAAVHAPSSNTRSPADHNNRFAPLTERADKAQQAVKEGSGGWRVAERSLRARGGGDASRVVAASSPRAPATWGHGRAEWPTHGNEAMGRYEALSRYGTDRPPRPPEPRARAQREDLFGHDGAAERQAAAEAARGVQRRRQEEALVDGDLVSHRGEVGVVRWTGRPNFATGCWVGVEFKGPVGDCNGVVLGKCPRRRAGRVHSAA